MLCTVTDPKALRNRLVIATGMWRDTTDLPLPKLKEATPSEQINEFEIKLVDLLCEGATPETAREIADKTWDMVHDRPETDPVRLHVTKKHEELANMSHSPFGA